ncbi:hypothetical protein ND861_06945 [Leptospira sp. 2 VSF19]|uniref:Lipoprotein n=1 Tax=Leptospira soteropolitanensis TaxID=2950025 RepID=A0AAW5VFD8_9LEPT|nr:hypothetical protein [Leptospira soteropolitanensis]MCW7492387.1 hypothetical protein [Leptospira soteropolitanensis]MCW7499967.1 hypothetical protein [Leptospira soteropolitanensis]MCW7522219.1 hypothetical protein [Leptospira soteropolitanensis]MCW7526074.1 hypothetical protein [Leptospira soteropolitanensis]MCW7529814.1 hypothetical protein [Leptospira soteropolitanensis]
MNRLFLILFFISFAFVGCKKEKDKSNSLEALITRFLIRSLLNSNIDSELPSNLSVAVPRSIRKPSSGLGASLGKTPKSVKSLSQTKGVAQDTFDAGFTGQAFLTEGTSIVSEILRDSKRDLVLISGAYKTAKSKPGVCIPGGTSTVRITQSMEDEFLEGMERLGLSADEARGELISLQNEGILPLIGQAVPTPAMVYRQLSNEYDVQVDYSFADSIGTPQPCPANNKFQKSIKFKSDKSKIFSSITRSLKVFGISLSVDASITYITQEGKKDKAILNIKQVTSGSGNVDKSTTRFTFEECENDTNANTNKCVTLSYSNVYDTSSGDKITTTVKGKTNDFGGYVTTEYIDNYNEEEYYLEETYDENGDTGYFAVDYYDVGNSTNDYEELGYYDSDLYGQFYESGTNAYQFEWDAFVDFSSAIPGATGIGIDAGFNEYDAYVLMPAGVDPNIYPDEYIGWGEFFNNVNSGGPVYYIDFYGTADQIPTAEVWRYYIDSSGNEQYVSVAASNTVVQI